MRPSRHLAVSTAVGGAAWAVTGEAWALPVAVGSGVLVDVDHAPDYWWTFALRRRPLAIFALHGWEWLLGLVAVGIWTGFPWWLLAVVLGYGSHLVTDHLFNGGGLWSYSLVFRVRHGFRKERVAPYWDFDHGYETLRKEVPIGAAIIEWWRRSSDVSRSTEGESATRRVRRKRSTTRGWRRWGKALFGAWSQRRSDGSKNTSAEAATRRSRPRRHTSQGRRGWRKALFGARQS